MKNSRESHFQGKYRIASARLPGWDYRTRACYFVTICTKNMIPSFGSVMKGEMTLNALGLFAKDLLEGLDKKKEHVKILNQIIMPNHIHLLIILTNNTDSNESNKFGPLLKGSLSSLINHFKGRVTKFANENSLFWPGWQERFHDHIVKSEASFNRISEYINLNPLKWNNDRYYQ